MRGDERDDAAGRSGCAAVVVAGLPETADVAADVAGEAFIYGVKMRREWMGWYGLWEVETEDEIREKRETRIKEGTFCFHDD